MEALRRKTLQWEKIDLKGKTIYNCLSWNDTQDLITFRNCLAVRGKINFGKLGFCSSCGKIMTHKQFVKHKNVKMGEICDGCYYLRKCDKKDVKESNGNLSIKYSMYCNRESCYCNKNSVCDYKSCHGYFCTDLEKYANTNLYLPSKILTINAFIKYKWELIAPRTSSYSVSFSHPRYNIVANIDKNGFLNDFLYKGVRCYFNEDSLLAANGMTVTSSQTIINAIRRLYK